MGDWADDLANDWIKDIRAGLLDEPALATQLRLVDKNSTATRDLLVALKTIMAILENAVDDERFGGPIVDNARAAIAKAEGK